jgi:putative PIN family toxin of toxin-antitoxin system
VKVVLDTSVFIAATLSKTGASAEPLRLWRDEARFDIAVSDELLREIAQVLSREKFAGAVGQTEVRRFIAEVSRNAIRYAVGTPRAASRDAKDDFLVELAKIAEADALVSLDHDLLDEERFGRVVALRPTALLVMLRETR